MGYLVGTKLGKGSGTLAPLSKVNLLAHLFDLVYKPIPPELHLKIRQQKHKKHLYDNRIYSYNMPPYLPTLNKTFIRLGEDAPYYGFPESKYIPYLEEVLYGFKIFHDCTLLKEEVYFILNAPSKKNWASEAS